VEVKFEEKWVEPIHELKAYMDLKKIDSITVANAIKISDKILSHLKTQRTTLTAERLYSIGKFYKDPIAITINAIYPNLRLPNRLIKTFEKEEETELGKLFFPKQKKHATLKEISYKTGISVDRLRDIMSKKSTIIRASELILLEMASERKTGELFTYLFKSK
jgi:hypothetical protein